MSEELIWAGTPVTVEAICPVTNCVLSRTEPNGLCKMYDQRRLIDPLVIRTRRLS